MKQKVLKYVIVTLVGILIVTSIILCKQIWKADLKEIYKILIDSFFATGVLFVCFGLLVISYNGGTFDMLSFGVMKFLNFFRKDMKKIRALSFYDYRVERHGKKKNFNYVIFIGIIFILISCLFLFYYYQV